MDLPAKLELVVKKSDTELDIAILDVAQLQNAVKNIDLVTDSLISLKAMYVELRDLTEATFNTLNTKVTELDLQQATLSNVVHYPDTTKLELIQRLDDLSEIVMDSKFEVEISELKQQIAQIIDIMNSRISEVKTIVLGKLRDDIKSDFINIKSNLSKIEGEISSLQNNPESIQNVLNVFMSAMNVIIFNQKNLTDKIETLELVHESKLRDIPNKETLNHRFQDIEVRLASMETQMIKMSSEVSPVQQSEAMLKKLSKLEMSAIAASSSGILRRNRSGSFKLPDKSLVGFSSSPILSPRNASDSVTSPQEANHPSVPQ